MSIIQFNLKAEFKNNDFFDLQNYLNNIINDIILFIDNFKHDSIELELQHNFTNENISTQYLNNLYCRLLLKSKNDSSVYIWLSENRIETQNLKKENLLSFNEIISIIYNNFDIVTFESEFIKLISLLKQLKQKSEKIIYKDYDKKIKTIINYFNNNKDKYIQNNDNNEFSYIDIELYKDKENNLISLNNGKYKSFFHFCFYLKIDDKEHIKQLLLQYKEKEAIDFYKNKLQSTNPFMYSIFSNYIEIYTYKTIRNAICIDFKTKSFYIDVLYDRILMEKQLNYF